VLKPTWLDGPPPHIGWWNASPFRRATEWRWWDGERWSSHAYSNESARIAGLCAGRPETKPVLIGSMRWTARWPEHGRVERRDPGTGLVTGPIACFERCRSMDCIYGCVKVRF
jgi:hypothetical protein